jgi:phenylpyruvate tautomerase PptA (4-oxalocrotonate tautomerase family)
MPLLKINTNRPLSGEQRADLLKTASKTVAEILGKPERYVMVTLEHNPDMMFAGACAPAAYLELKSIGLPGERTGDLSAHLCSLIEDSLDIPRDRVYIEFADAIRHMWGWNGTTF